MQWQNFPPIRFNPEPIPFWTPLQSFDCPRSFLLRPRAKLSAKVNLSLQFTRQNRSMSDDRTAGVSYLAALRQASAPAGAAASPAPENGSQFKEKRRSPRYRCQGSAHLREIRTNTATWATFTDISTNGCYVEAMSTFRKGAELALTLEVNGYRLECRGTVQLAYPGLGMGVAFTTISEENRERLRELLESLSQPPAILGSRADSSGSSASSEIAFKNPTAALQAISDFFTQRQMLDRDEFFRILRKSQD
jgi:hypothetical protein